jgi:hypothetical protein
MNQLLAQNWYQLAALSLHLNNDLIVMEMIYYCKGLLYNNRRCNDWSFDTILRMNETMVKMKLSSTVF